LGGTNPNNCSHSNIKSPLLTPTTGSPLIGRPNCSVTSSNLSVNSPCWRWKIYAFILHLSTNVMIKWWLMLIFVKGSKYLNPSTCIKNFTYGSISIEKYGYETKDGCKLYKIVYQVKLYNVLFLLMLWKVFNRLSVT